MNIKTNNYYKYLIYIIPAVYLLLGFYFRQIFGDLSLRSVDPDYLHFLSGLCISTGKLSQANIDHPGTPLQILLAIIFQIIYFFRSHNLSYFQDVILHSDFYLAIGNLTVTVLIAAVLFWVGKAVYRVSGNLLYALVIQTAPLLIKMWYDIIGRIYPELLFVIPVFILVFLLFREMFSAESRSGNSVVLFALAVGLGLALKMTFVPFMVLPLFIIRKNRNRIKYLLFTIFFFFLFALPVLFQFNRFQHWMIGIFVHSGPYNSGNSNIIDVSSFLKNTHSLYASQKLFFYAFFVMVGLLIIFLFLKKTKTSLFRISLGLTIAFLGMIFIMGKHYQMRYFIPALLFLPFVLVVDMEMLVGLFKKKAVFTGFVAFLVLIIGVGLIKRIPDIRFTSQYITAQMAAREKTAAFVQTLPADSYKIIVSQDYGCPLQAYAIMYSFCVAGKNWPGYKEKLNRLYPNTYQYFTWDNTLKYWGKPFNPDTVIHSGKPVYLYLQKNTNTLYSRAIRKLFIGFPGFSVQKKLIFENPKNGEVLLQLFLSKSVARDVSKTKGTKKFR